MKTVQEHHITDRTSKNRRATDKLSTAESDRIKPVSAWRDEVHDAFFGEQRFHGAKLPWGTADPTWRFEKGEMTAWAGYNGSGKSLMISQMALWSLRKGHSTIDEKIGLINPELSPKNQIKRLVKQSLGSSNPSEKWIENLYDWTEERFYIYQTDITMNATLVCNIIHYMVEELHCTQIIIDNLSKINIAEDDYNRQKQFVDYVFAMTKYLPVHVHLVMHTRKPMNEFVRPNKMDIKGTGAIIDTVDNAFIVWRNKKKEDDIYEKQKSEEESINIPDTKLYCVKGRNDVEEGILNLYFNKPGEQFVHAPGKRYTIEEIE